MTHRRINLIYAAIATLIFTVAWYAAHPQQPRPPVLHRPISTAWDVPAVMFTTPASHPCNHQWPAGAVVVPAVCITEDETHWKCSDRARALLQSEDGVHHCILFPQQQKEIVTVTHKETKKP